MLHSLNFIFFFTYNLEAKLVFLMSKPFQASNMQHSSLLGSIISYKENVALWLLSLTSHSLHFIFLITYELDE